MTDNPEREVADLLGDLDPNIILWIAQHRTLFMEMLEKGPQSLMQVLPADLALKADSRFGSPAARAEFYEQIVRRAYRQGITPW